MCLLVLGSRKSIHLRTHTFERYYIIKNPYLTMMDAYEKENSIAILLNSLFSITQD